MTKAGHGNRQEITAAEYLGLSTEDEWKATVKGLAERHGWIVLLEIPDEGFAAIAVCAKKFRLQGLYKLLAALSGWPDLILGHPETHTVIGVELKVKGKHARANQEAKAAVLRRCGIDVHLWQTGDPNADLVLDWSGT